MVIAISSKSGIKYILLTTITFLLRHSTSLLLNFLFILIFIVPKHLIVHSLKILKLFKIFS